jgi:hypothetical protein
MGVITGEHGCARPWLSIKYAYPSGFRHHKTAFSHGGRSAGEIVNGLKDRYREARDYLTRGADAGTESRNADIHAIPTVGLVRFSLLPKIHGLVSDQGASDQRSHAA